MNFASELPFAAGICAALLSFGALLRGRRSIANWAFAVGMLLLAGEAVCMGFTLREPYSLADMLRWQHWRLIDLSLVPGVWLVFSLNYARGEAHHFLKKWRFFLAATFLLPIATALFFLSKGVFVITRNEANSHLVVQFGWPGVVLYVFLMIGSVLVLMNLERTFRAAVGTSRWRIKFMLLGVGVLFVVRVYTSSQALLFHGTDLSVESLNSGAILVAALLVARSFFRPGQFEVDVYPSQSVLQNSITVLVAGLYLVLVGILAKIANYLGGDASFAIKAFLALVSLVALAVFLQSDRARLYLRHFVSRNFQRPLHDYRTVWRKFTEGTASRVDQTDLCRVFVKLIADTFQALSVAIWLVDDNHESISLVASTFLSKTKGQDAVMGRAETEQMISHFHANPGPSDIESSETDWAAAVRRLHPSEFLKGGHRICVPLISQGDVIGLITAGDRVGGRNFNLQDLDMFRCIGDHATASLRNVQLSNKLLQSKELESFQTMATFFVHDLKNAASTLNLMLQNLPVHFDDPAFREDSLRGISKTVTHINRLIGRLSLLRHEEKLTLVEADLNEVVANAIVGLERGAGSMLSKDLRPLPKVMLDREQINKVVTNLVLNATEAVSADGKVRVETARGANGVILTVIDNGCGMTPEFLSRGLFRPFQTTKKSGLGIGMFQSKMIVQSHGGRIEVSSEQGKGTTFHVFLPAPKVFK